MDEKMHNHCHFRSLTFPRNVEMTAHINCGSHLTVGYPSLGPRRPSRVSFGIYGRWLPTDRHATSSAAHSQIDAIWQAPIMSPHQHQQKCVESIRISHSIASSLGGVSFSVVADCWRLVFKSWVFPPLIFMALLCELLVNSQFQLKIEQTRSGGKWFISNFVALLGWLDALRWHFWLFVDCVIGSAAVEDTV